ncbi:pentachlorophenol 4-monooxygenase, partial [Magnaporthiopsis poae ATCC 64411]
MQEQVDILIVGAGPTGLALALELAKHGASFRIVEKELERDSTSRALVIQPRTQELLNRHTNFREEVLARSSTVRGVRWHLSKTRHAHVDFTKTGLVDTSFPSIINLSQVETERFLESSLGRVTAPGGGRYMVERGLAATAIVQDPDGVTVTLSRTSKAGEGGNGKNPAEQTVRCKYVVGCDGSHSAVRKAATSIRYEGGTYQHDFILCDAT